MFHLTPIPLRRGGLFSKSALCFSSSTPLKTLPLPQYFQALTDKDVSDCNQIVNAYEQYYNHKRFKDWGETPAFARDEAQPVFEEAAEVVWRIRHALDQRQKRESPDAGPTLRMLDGNAQMFLRSDEAKELWKSCAKTNKDAFTKKLVHETFKDARGYVEKLQPAEIDIFFGALQEHRYDPVVHARSVIQELTERHQEILLIRSQMKKDEKFIEADSEEDKLWKNSIGKLYEANALFSDVKVLMEGKSKGKK